MTAFWDVVLCNQHPDDGGNETSETSVYLYDTTRHHIPKAVIADVRILNFTLSLIRRYVYLAGYKSP